MKIDGTKVLKFVVPVATAVIGGVSTWLSNKEFDEKVAKKVAEELAKNSNKEA